MVMVLLFRINEKIVTPTTVILMTMATIPGFLVHVFWLKDFSPTVMGYWLAAVPIVAVGAPCWGPHLPLYDPSSNRQFLLALIALEFVSTVVLVPFSVPCSLHPSAPSWFAGSWTG